MATTGEIATWVADPDLVVSAIKQLVYVAATLGASALGLVLYIDKTRMNKIDEMATDIKKIANTITQNAIDYEHRLTGVESRVSNLEGDVDNMARLCEDRRKNGMHPRG